MGFGQAAGPPASAAQIRELLALLQAAGHEDFRDARRPMGFTQRQAGGKFTRDEAAAFIAELECITEAAELGGEAPERPVPPPRLTAAEKTLRSMRDEQLAAELQRRGWIVIEP